MHFRKSLVTTSILLASISFSGLISAAGLWLYEGASPEVGTASAGRNAIADNAATAAFNPAGMTRLDRDELLAGFQPMYVDARFDIDNGSGSGGGNGGNAGGWVPALAVYYVHELAPDLKFGLSSGSYLGLGVDFGTDWGGRYFVTDGELLTLLTKASLGYKVNDKLSIGGSINMVYSKLTQKIAWNNNPLNIGNTADGQIKIEESELSFGFGVSMLYEFTTMTRVGFIYNSEVDLEFDDAISTKGISGITGIPDYFLGDPNVDLEMTLPQAVSFSVFHQLNDDWAVVGSLGWQDWSAFGKTDLIFSGGARTTYDRNYDDTWNAAVGFHYQWSDKWKLMSGIAYDSSPVSDKDRTIDLPLDRQIRYALGAQYELSKDITVSGAYELMDAGKASVNQAGLARQGGLDGEFKTNFIHIFTINASWKY
ncbi:OmpP1/FadL family transporter [sulfur-oxidizing endosymbiont of Gigantopelta aegis]|uniref:OmpP1/FadL family transporter n=1 Tax=sulfur-oxidizing endosymbiont of Gigantopelta aegis TaxID=2794934 RepID=UPI0018DC4BCF|nr:outer membrane protein transport protein [sulfur-oxidizing endosymbiont of Gigantopelta aegis]